MEFKHVNGPRRFTRVLLFGQYWAGSGSQPFIPIKWAILLSCQRQKAPYQTYFKFASRFYTGYLTEFAKKSKQYTFTRNCFVRPEYNSSLKIVIKDHDNGAKSFKFRCTSCPYIFQTSIIRLPKPLYDIIENDKNDSFSKLCNEIRNGVLKGQIEEKISEQTRRNLELMNKGARQKKDVIFMKKYPFPKRLTMKKSIYCVKCSSKLSTE